MPFVKRGSGQPFKTAGEKNSAFYTPQVAPRQWKALFADFLERLPKSQAACGAATHDLDVDLDLISVGRNGSEITLVSRRIIRSRPDVPKICRVFVQKPGLHLRSTVPGVRYRPVACPTPIPSSATPETPDKPRYRRRPDRARPV